MPKLKMIEEIAKRTMRPNMPRSFVMPRIRGGITGSTILAGFPPRRGFFSLAADAASAFRVRRAA